MYTEAQKRMRRCKKLKKNGEQCKGYARLDGDFCTLHSTYDPHAPRPKKGAERKASKYRRALKGAGKHRRATCSCPAFPFVHRLSSGGCRYPEKPAEVYRVEDSERSVSDERSERQTEREIERDDTRMERSEVTAREEEAMTSGAVCHCSKFPFSHRLHERAEQQSGDGNLSDLESEIKYQRSKMWNY
jgi:hypothetical protein